MSFGRIFPEGKRVKSPSNSCVCDKEHMIGVSEAIHGRHVANLFVVIDIIKLVETGQ